VAKLPRVANKCASLAAAPSSQALPHAVPNTDVQALAQSLATVTNQAVFSSTLIPTQTAPVSVTPPPVRVSSIPKLNDPHKFKGIRIDGADATSFLLTLEDLFELHQVPP
jgi:hypothetical protein